MNSMKGRDPGSALKELEVLAVDCQATAGRPESGPTVTFGNRIPTLREIEKKLIEEALCRARGNQSIAARMLGISRAALYKRLNRGTA